MQVASSSGPTNESGGDVPVVLDTFQSAGSTKRRVPMQCQVPEIPTAPGAPSSRTDVALLITCGQGAVFRDALTALLLCDLAPNLDLLGL